MKNLYVAVSVESLKAATLVDLLDALSKSRQMTLAVACSDQCTLDLAVGRIRRSFVHAEVRCLHGDMKTDEVSQTLQSFNSNTTANGQAHLSEKQSTTAPAIDMDGRETRPVSSSRIPDVNGASTPEQPRETDGRLSVLAMTHHMLSTIQNSRLRPSLQLLIHFDLPYDKEVLASQASMLGASAGPDGKDSIAIFFVVAHQVAAFRELERDLGSQIDVMPVHASDIFSEHC